MRGSAETVAELKGVDKEADSLDGRDINLDVDKDGSASNHLQTLSGGFKSLAGNIRATSTVLAASTIPFAIAGIGAATPAVLALGASLGGLALNLGKAAAGFGLVAAAAGGGALVGLKAYGSLISKTLSDSRTLWEKENSKAVEALQKQRLAILSNARGFDAWNQQINSSLIGFTHLEAAVGSRIFPIFTRELSAWTRVLTQMRPFIADTAGRIAQIAVGFSRWFRTADDGQVLREVVGFLSISAERGAKALSALGQIGISAFRPLIPLASAFQKTVLDILGATNKWVQSAQGQKRLGQIYRGLWNDARKLWPVVRDLSISVGQFFNLLDRTGIADQASRGLRIFAHWLREATQRGGGLEDFLRNARDLMPFVGRAVVAVATAIGKIASAAISARQAGSKLTILQQIFNGIKNAAKPLQGLVVGTFRDLGPIIADLVPALARFFKVFAGSSGPLVTFVSTLTKALKAFNHLPAPVRRTVAQLAALKLILGGLGVGAVVAPMGRFASNMVIARGAAAKLAGKSALAGVAGGLTKIGLVLAGGIGLGLLAAGLVRAYNKNEAFRKSVNRLGDKAKQAFGGVQRTIDRQVLPALGRLADRGADAIIDIFDLDKGGKRAKIKSMGSRAGNAYRVGVLGGGGGDANAWVEAGNKIGKQIAKGLNAFANSGRWKDSGLHLTKRLNSGSNPVWVGEQLGKGVRKGLDKTDWRAVGERIIKSVRRGVQDADWTGMGRYLAKRVVLGVTGLGIAADVSKWITKGIRRGVDAVGWEGIGRYLVKRFVFGVTNVGIAAPISKWLANGIRQATKNAGWFEAGKNAALGYLKGFREGGIGGGIVGILNNARKAVKNWQKEKSPSKLWMEQGKNAGLGYLEGFKGAKIGEGIARELRDGIVNLGAVPRNVWNELLKRGWKGSPRDSAERLYRPGRLDDGFRTNSRQSSNRGKPGYVQDEDGSWVRNPELYRLQNRYHTGHTYQRGGVGHAFEWTGSGYRYIGGPMGGAHRMAHHAARHMGGRMFEGLRAGRMTDELRGTLRYLRAHPNNYDIGGDVDIKDTPRKVLQFLKRDGWFRRGGSLYHPDTPKRVFHGSRQGYVRAADGSLVRKSLYPRIDGHGINKNEMRDVMREHRHESRKGGDGIDYNRLAHAIVGAMREGLPGFIDHSMGGYFHHRNAAGADPR